MPDTPSPKPANILMVLLDDLFIPVWNPRKFIDPIELADLVAYIEKGGWVPRVLILKADKGWWVISGQRRVLAHRKLGKTNIEAEVMDITLEEAKIMAETSNEGPKPYWLDSYENWETLLAENPDWTKRGLADKLGKDKSIVNRATLIMDLLNPASRAMIRESLNSQKPLNLDGSVSDGDTDPENKGNLWKLNSETVRKLIPLLTGREKVEAQALSEKAVKIILDRRMTGPKAAELVSFINTGGSPEEFGTTKSAPKKPKPTDTPSHIQTADTSEPVQPQPTHSAPAHTAAPSGTPSANGQYKEPLAQSTHAPQHVASAQTKVYMFRDWLAGVKVIPQLKHKVEKGQDLTFGETMILGGYRLGEAAHWLWKEILKPMLKSLSEGLKRTLGKGLYNFILLVLVCFVLWKVWNRVHIGFHSINWIESKLSHEQSEPAPVSTPQPAASTILPKVEAAVSHLVPERKTEKTAPAATPAVVYQPSVSFLPTVYDPKYFDSEIQALPQNCIVKAFPVEPDESMPVDLATSRLQDLTDTDKYTMRLGNSTEKILSVIPSETTLTVNFKSTDALGSLFGDHADQRIYFWEDVLVIHSDEIDIDSKMPYTLYQCSLIVSGSKNPLTIQCASAADLKHLVSTMEYFIRASRLGHDAALAGMPYSSQGLRLNNEGLVTTLWAGSPVEKAGVKVSDMLWSLEKNEQVPQDHKKLETQLAALAPGQHTLYIANNADFTKAQSDVAFNRASSLNPKRRKVALTI